MNEPYLPLSDEGERRKEKILEIARREAGRLRHWRGFRRVGVVAMAMGLAATLVVQSRRWRTSPEIVHHSPRPQHDPAPPVVEPVVTPIRHAVASARRPKEVVITRVMTDPGIARKLAVKSAPTGWKQINDDELLAELAAAHRPAGLAYVDGREIVLFRIGDGGADMRTYRR
jgi:hypothetical protein